MTLKTGIAFLVLIGFAAIVRGQQLNDVLITEIMSDPAPSVGLPEAEYIELYNHTAQPVSLKGWVLYMGSRSAVLPDSVLQPSTYLLICHRNNISQMQSYGKAIGVSNFLLPNEHATVSLYHPSKRLIYSVVYDESWWPAEKRAGGYALELIDLNNPCLERENWSVSTDPKGGTPCRINSVGRTVFDQSVPTVERIDIASETELILLFNKRLDSLNAVAGASITLTGRQIVERRLESPSFRSLTLKLDAPLLNNTAYTLTLRNLADCGGNMLREVILPIGVAVDADSGDVIINEVLFNPKVGGVDFVELYNRSSHFVKVTNWKLANTKDGSIDVTRTVTTENVVLPPRGFLALTTDALTVKEQYPLSKNGHFLELPSMPSFVNDEGGVVLLNQTGEIQELFLYSEKMHHPLLDAPKGVSLERIDSEQPASDPSNWQSAASINGYATPGYTNSQVARSTTDEDFVVLPEVFTPNMDGVDDLAEILFTQNLSGRMATIRIFDVNGRLVRPIIENLLIGTQGKLSWDGLDLAGRIVKTGYYLIMIDTFDLLGNKRQYRKKVVVVNE